MNKPNPSNSLINSREVGSSDAPSIQFNMLTKIYLDDHRILRRKHMDIWRNYFSDYYQSMAYDLERIQYYTLEELND